jgi:hypothetical protein
VGTRVKAKRNETGKILPDTFKVLVDNLSRVQKVFGRGPDSLKAKISVEQSRKAVRMNEIVGGAVQAIQKNIESAIKRVKGVDANVVQEVAYDYALARYGLERNQVDGAGDGGGKPDGMHLDTEGPDIRVGVGDNRGANRGRGFSRDESVGSKSEPAHVKRGPAPRDHVATP